MLSGQDMGCDDAPTDGRRSENPQSEISNPRSPWLAWGSWRMRIPPRWRPVKIEGDSRGGRIYLGADEAMVLQVKWRRMQAENFDPHAWIRTRLASDASAAVPQEQTPRTDDFPLAAWAPRVASADGNKAALWYGWSPRARLVLELVFNVTDDRSVARTAEDLLLPSLGSAAADEPGVWAVYGASFRSPPGLELVGRELFPGRISLRLASGGRVMALQQLFPAELSLSRRELGRWVGYMPFRERRRRAGPPDGEPCEFESLGRSLPGVIRYSYKQFGYPMHWIARRRNVAAVAHDAELDRLLLAELDSPGGWDEDAVREAIAAMNWDRGPGEPEAR
ncbi:MAG: hypothetical protein BIFFINMI_00795 [Phycisphaerae bacterium]|nr:hypothetical protein [Phycisphaerae bacterium]